MPLILAIEPDRRQANQLTALVRGRLRAELVLGDSADRALAALGDRVPDLVLTAALLSPKDEAALGQRLRQLNGVAAHVQTLTIPVLASGKSHGDGLRAGGILSALRRDKTKGAATDGCDPAVFAEQCKEYLARAASERELSAGEVDRGSDDGWEPKPIEAKTPALAQPIADTRRPDPIETQAPAFVETQALAFVEEEPASFVEPEVSVAAEHHSTSMLVDEPASASAAAAPEMTAPGIAFAPPAKTEPRPRKRLAPHDTDGPASLVAALALIEAEEEAARGPVVSRPAGADDASADDMDLSALLDPNHGVVRGAAARERHDTNVEVYDLDATMLQADDAIFVEEPQQTMSETELYLPLPGAVAGAWPAFDAPSPDAPAAAVAAETSLPQDAKAQDEPEPPKEWFDILEALRRDAESMPARHSGPVETRHAEDRRVDTLRAEHGSVAAGHVGESRADERHIETGDVHEDGVETTLPSPVNPSAPESPSKKKRRRRSESPAQDEWGFFDPDQCGFAALLEKLQEITDQDDAPTRRR